jgi:hypothetical protein
MVTNSRITVNGAGGVTNEDTLSVGADLFSVTTAAATFTDSPAAGGDVERVRMFQQAQVSNAP